MRTLSLLVLLCLAVACQQVGKTEMQEIAVESPVIANDISNQKIVAFAEDAQGHIWLGTFRGLNKYNVHEYHQYFCTDDSLDLPDNQINDIYRDSQNRLWIATVNGVCQYTEEDNFKRIPINFNNKNGYQFVENKEGRIFLNTVIQLCAYDPQTQQFECIIPRLDPNRTFHGKCHIDPSNNLWVANPLALRCYDSSTMELKDSIPVQGYPVYSYLHENGEMWLTGNHNISIFDTRTRSFKEVPEAIKKHPVLSCANIEYIHPYGNNCLLLNTSKQGMFCYNYIENTVIHQDDNGFPFEVPRFKINKMFTDSQKNLWIGSVDQGYVVRYYYKERFNNNNYLRTCVENKSVVALAIDKEQHLWISTLMDGLYMYNLDSKEVQKVSIPSLSQEEQENPEISYIFVDEENAIWMSTNSHKVLRCHYRNGKLEVEASYPIFLARYITQDKNKTIWVSTSIEYVHAMRKGETSFTPIQIYPTSFTFIPCLLPLSSGPIITAAFYHPMRQIDPDSWKVEDVQIPAEDLAACIRRSVIIPVVMHEDMQGDVWIGTITNGLLRYSPSTKRMRSMTGIPCTDISSIEEDVQGNIWVGTLYGLSKYDRTIDKFTNYYAADGIGGNQFYERASCRLPDGTLVFGATHGLTFFNPIDVQTKRNIPLLFEDLKIHNKLIRPQDSPCIEKHLSHKPDIHLKYNQNSFSISFAALDYCEHEHVHYYYQLEGFDKYWIDAHNNREAYYANLSAGEYTFKVKITNNDKSIVEAENSIQIIVYPAPWETWWAYCIYFIAAASIIWLFANAWQRIRREKAAVRQAELEKAQEQRVNKMNMSFFANVSHEFRTPLTMISGPVAQLCNAPDITGNNKNLLYIVQRSVNRMLRLVNQMMDFNKLENDTLKLKVKRADIIASLQRLVDIFRVNAENKNIALNTYGLEDTFLLWLDEDKTDKIVGNLMSNAMKFTPTGGKISVCFNVITREEAAQLFALTPEDKDTQYVKITVANTGQDIPEDKLEKIFERYYQMANQTEGTYNWGTGIGLYYARSLAELHHGHLKASKPNEGSGAAFTLILPVNDLSYTEEERAPEQNNQSEAFPLPANVPFQSEEPTEKPEEQKMILVVDDDTEVAHYLSTLLSPHYKIVCRFNADSALKAMKEEAPDLILSDVVMPGKDGYQLCREVKEDLQLCHIPVILVTAKATVENQVEGLNTGADAYVTKPFEPSYLLALIQSQLKNRENVRSLLGKATQVDKIEENVLSPQDNAFMTDLYRLMENEISNPELDIARMTELLKISRTKFYYKVKGLTGENPSIFFKTYKLNRAAELIAEGKHTISEIADITGFSTLSHFSKSFKKQFGLTPSEYHK